MRSVASTAVDDRLVSTGSRRVWTTPYTLPRRQIADGIVKLKVIAKCHGNALSAGANFAESLQIERGSSASRNLFGSLVFRCEAHIYSSPLQKKGNPKNVLK